MSRETKHQTSMIYFNLVLEVHRKECLRKVSMWISLTERTVANCNKRNKKKKKLVTW